jgi:DNA-binding response OmpR family regulator/MinD-like ATPase involved in chromosome partitioning or flagellar assembly
MSPTRSRPRVLVVDDDDNMRALLREVCEMQNLEPLEAATGRTALLLAASAKPDLVLLDWGLPDTTGIEVCRELRRAGVSVPIIMLTGHGDDREIIEGLAQGADEYLTKPIRPRILAARMAAHLRRASSETERLKEDAVPHLALLNKVAIFLDHPAAALRVLAKRSVSIKVRSGAQVLTQGAPNDTLYIVQEGTFQVTTVEADRDPFPVTRLGQAELFGATSLLTNRPSLATVTALEDSHLVRISRDDLLAELVPGTFGRGQLEALVVQRLELIRGLHERIAPTGAVARLVSIYSPGGGVGKTTLALNLAASLARQHRGRVVLMDLALPYNHAALLAGLAPSNSLARLADVGTGFDERLQGALVRHPAGFLLLPTALVPEEADLITLSLAGQALDVLKQRFDYIIVDLGVVLSEVALSVLEQSQAVFLMATPDRLNVSALTNVLSILQEILRLAAGQVHLVLNHRSADAAVERKEMEKLLGFNVAVEIRHDGRRPEMAAIKGEILAVSAINTPIAKAAASLARLID